jgi:hypothetical protein
VTKVGGLTGMKCWGSQAFGQLGNGIQSYINPQSLLPVDVTGLTGAAGQPQISVASAGAAHTCVILNSSGVVTCWGWNNNGQLGNGSTSDSATWQSQQQDWDKDGCADYREVETTSGSQGSGGLRNPKIFWDFFDTPNMTSTTLSAQVGIGDVPPFTVTVISTNGFPAGSFFIDNEKFSYDSSTSTTFHVTVRAVDQTIAAQHNISARVVSNVRDRLINNADLNAVTTRYGFDGDPTIDPLSPPPATGYHTAFDRGAQIGANPWNRAPPDGHIRSADISAVNSQLNHTCQ